MVKFPDLGILPTYMNNDKTVAVILCGFEDIEKVAECNFTQVTDLEKYQYFNYTYYYDKALIEEAKKQVEGNIFLHVPKKPVFCILKGSKSDVFAIVAPIVDSKKFEKVSQRVARKKRRETNVTKSSKVMTLDMF